MTDEFPQRRHRHPANPPGGERRLAPFLVISLLVLTLLNGYALVRGVQLWRDEMEHGGDIDDTGTLLAIVTVTESVLSLGALGCVWRRHLWGVGAYAAVKVLALVVGVGLTQAPFSHEILLPVGLALVLWWATASAGWLPARAARCVAGRGDHDA